MSGSCPRSESDPRRGRDILSTLDVARLLGIAPRTVAKWIDSGRLPGVRIPGTRTRRTTRGQLDEFCRATGFHPASPAPRLDGRLVSVLSDPLPGLESVTPFALGRLAQARDLAAVVVGYDRGFVAAVELAREVQAACPTVPLALLLPDDRDPAEVPLGLFSRVFGSAPNGDLVRWLHAGVTG